MTVGSIDGTVRWQLIAERWQDMSDPARPFTIRGRHEMTEVARGEIPAQPARYLLKVSVLAEGVEHPIADLPFAFGIGHWVWVPPITDDDEDQADDLEPGRPSPA